MIQIINFICIKITSLRETEVDIPAGLSWEQKQIISIWTPLLKEFFNKNKWRVTGGVAKLGVWGCQMSIVLVNVVLLRNSRKLLFVGKLDPNELCFVADRGYASN